MTAKKSTTTAKKTATATKSKSASAKTAKKAAPKVPKVTKPKTQPKPPEPQEQAVAAAEGQGPLDATYRVFHLPEGLKKGVQALNATTPGSTLQKLVAHSVEQNLPAIVSMLVNYGIAGGDERKPIRVKISDQTLEALARASQQTGVDQRILLCAALTLSTAE